MYSARARILELVAQRHPNDDPVDTIMTWLAELTGTRLDGEPLLGLELEETGLDVARAMLPGGSFEDVVHRLTGIYDAADLAAQADGLRALYDALRTSLTLRPLFNDDEAA